MACVPWGAHSQIDSGDESQHGHGEEIGAGNDVEVVLVVEETFYRR